MFRREYYPSDTLKLVNQSEGKIGSTGKAAHALSRHLMKSAPGAVLWNDSSGKVDSVGITGDDFRDRFKSSPGTANSGWLGKGDMAILLCEALNSDVGQEALGALDAGVTRVAIHYLNLKKLAKLFDGLGNVDMKSSNWLVTPARVEMVSRTFSNSKGETFTKQIRKKIAKQVTSAVKPVDLAAVHVVLDNVGGRLHLQTLFPGADPVESHADWVLGVLNVTVTVDSSGSVVKTTLPR